MLTAEQLRAFRERHGYTQVRLARILGYRTQHGDQNVIKMENGRGGIPGAIDRIVTAIDRSPNVRLVFEALAT